MHFKILIILKETQSILEAKIMLAKLNNKILEMLAMILETKESTTH